MPKMKPDAKTSFERLRIIDEAIYKATNHYGPAVQQKHLAEMCHVNKATIERDIKAMREELGAEIEFYRSSKDLSNYGYRYVRPNFCLLNGQDYDRTPMIHRTWR